MIEKKRREIHPALEYGKIPPQAVDLEEAVLSALISESHSLIKVKSILKPESFYKDHHQKIYKAILSLDERREPIDLLTVTSELRRMGELEYIGGAYALAVIHDKVSSSAHIEYHARIIDEAYIGREVIQVASNAIKDAFEDSCDKFEVRDKLLSEAAKIGLGSLNKDKSVSDVELEFKKYLDDVLNGRIKMIKSGLSGFDNFNGGLFKGDLVVIGAWSSNGKTMTALNILLNASKENKCKFYSFEQTELQLYIRNVSMLSQNNSREIMKGIVRDFFRLDIAKIELGKRNIKYGKTSNHIRDLVNDITRESVENGTEVFIIDYLQLLTSDEDDLRKSIASIANKLKMLARELNIVIILLSQLKRSDGKGKPGMSGLKEAGEIENAADIVLTSWIPRNEPSDLDNINFKGCDYSTQYFINGIEYKLMLFFQNKGRNSGITSFIGYHDEFMKIHNDLPIEPMNADLHKTAQIKPNNNFNDEKPF